MTVLVRRERVLVHELRARHATTRVALPVRARFAARPPAGLGLRVAAGVVVVSHDTVHELPDDPVTVQLTVDEPVLRLTARTAEVVLTAPQLVHEFAPLPSTVEVRLHQRTGAALPGRVVTVRGTDGSELRLPETGPGTYAVERTWGSEFARLDVRVDGASARLVPYDPAVRVQRIRLADPT